jgi:hypothetical protein
MTATFALVTRSTGGNKIACNTFSTVCFSFDMIDCEFINFIVITAINTLTIEVLFNSSSPELFSVGTCHGY